MCRFVIASLALLIASHSFAAELYVAPNGNDSNPGTKDQPLASGAPLEDVMVPPIDTEQTADFETATFASG